MEEIMGRKTEWLKARCKQIKNIKKRRLLKVGGFAIASVFFSGSPSHAVYDPLELTNTTALAGKKLFLFSVAYVREKGVTTVIEEGMAVKTCLQCWELLPTDLALNKESICMYCSTLLAKLF